MGIKNKIINLLDKIKKPKIIWLSFISLLVSFFGLILPRISYALFDTLAAKITTFPILLIGEIVAFVAAQLITLEAAILDAIVSGSLFTKLIFVQKGWTASRDIANLFFIAILIYIAFAVILRLQKIDAKKLLFKVIFIAIIINFSLMIGGMIIDASQVMFKFFIFGGLKEGASFSMGLANSLDIQKYWGAAPGSKPWNNGVIEDPLDGLSFSKQVMVRITQTLTRATLMSISVIVLGALALVLIIRNIWLWVLLIIAPIAWFVGIVPLGEISSLGKKWWGNFIKWAFIAPIMGFFIYLVIMMGSPKIKEAGSLIKVSEDEEQQQLATKGSSFDDGGNFNLVNILQFIVVIGLMVGSLMAGQSLGLKAANGAIGMATKAGKNTQRWMGRKAMQSPPARSVGNVLMGMGNIPLIGGAFKRAGMATQGGVAKAQKDDLKSAQGRVNNLSDKQIDDNWNSFNQWEKQAATKKKGYDKLNERQFEDMQSIYSRTGMDKEKKDMEKAAPQFTPGFKKEAEEFEKGSRVFSEANKKNEATDVVVKVMEKEYESDKAAQKTAEEKVTEKTKVSKVAKENVKKAQENVEVLKLSDVGGVEGAMDDIRKDAMMRLDAEKAKATEAEKEEVEAVKEAKNSKDKSDASSKNLKEIRERGRVDKEKAENEFNKAAAPMMERFKDDLSKLNKLGDLVNEKDNDELPTERSKAMSYIISQKSSGEISKVLSNVVAMGNDGKKDINETFARRKEIGINIAENIYLHGGTELSEKMDAVLKMRNVDSSPSALAGGYGFNAIVDGMQVNKTITDETAKLIKIMAKEQKGADKVIADLAKKVANVTEKGGEAEPKPNKETEETSEGGKAKA